MTFPLLCSQTYLSILQNYALQTSAALCGRFWSPLSCDGVGSLALSKTVATWVTTVILSDRSLPSDGWAANTSATLDVCSCVVTGTLHRSAVTYAPRWRRRIPYETTKHSRRLETGDVTQGIAGLHVRIGLQLARRVGLTSKLGNQWDRKLPGLFARRSSTTTPKPNYPTRWSDD